MALEMVILTVYIFLFRLVVFEVYTLPSPAKVAGLILFHLDFILYHDD